MPSALIFISSVQREFAEERQALKAFIEGDPLLRRFFSAFIFEDLPAQDQRADHAYLDAVERCALYVGVFGLEYGSEGARGVSPTQREFEHAELLGKPRLIFVKQAEPGARHAKMEALIRQAEAQVIRRSFGSLPELVAGLYASLVDHLGRTGALRDKPFDAAACHGASLADLSQERLDWLLERARIERAYPLPPGTSMETALAHLDLLDGGAPSHAAVLLLGREPQRFLISSEVKCMHFHGKEVQKPIPSYQIYKGTVFEMVDKALDFVMSKIDRRVGTRAEGPQAPVAYELPQEVVAEAIVNAVAHRDYASNASVQVMLFADRLEVWNPGELPPSLTIADLQRPHASIPRNPLIAESLFLAHYVEKAGSGILDMIARCGEAGLAAPAFRQKGGQFVQTVARAHLAVTPGVTPGVTPEVTPELRLLRVLEGEMSRKELQVAMKLKDAEHFRTAILAPAIAAGFVEMTIPGSPNSRLQKYRRTAFGERKLRKGG
jgi:hypothetical protein